MRTQKKKPVFKFLCMNYKKQINQNFTFEYKLIWIRL